MAHDELLSDTFDLQAGADAPERSRANPAQGRGQAGLLLLFGFVSTVTGLVLAVAPVVSWKAAQIMVGLDYLGVHGGTLFIGGLLLVGVGMLRRNQQALAVSVDQALGNTSLIEEMVTDVVQMRNALDHLQMVSSQMQDEVSEARQATYELLNRPLPQPAPQPQPAAGDGQGEAVFRLAASLDKVGARIEERMKSQFSTLRERLDSVQSGIENRQEALEARLEEFATAPTPAVSRESAPEQAPVQQAMPAPASEPRVHEEMQPEPQPENQWQAPGEPVAYEPPPAPVESPLGVLDMIEPDEPFAPLPDAAMQADFSHSQSLQGLREVQPGGPLPTRSETPAAGPWGGELQLNTPEASLSPEERERLLAETRLRQSLQNMQRNPGQSAQDFGA